MKKLHLVILALVGIAASGIIGMVYLNSLQSSALEKTVKIIPENVVSTPKNIGSVPDVPAGSVLRDAHEHASILVKSLETSLIFQASSSN
jgi:Flp pilus assembly protein CpaB